MATLVLGAVGSAVGGPLGGTLGALLGQSLDQGFFGSSRRGPRLRDLSVQTSSYGNQVPKLFGTLRVAGTIVWAMDIKERPADTGGYAYSASFAVALSSRPIRRVIRIWADGSLLRGAAGDFKVRTGFRLHRGDEDQGLDPLIAAVEGLERAPAYRGLALAVFEDLELASFGNRIPSLTFEVEADEGSPFLSDMLAEASSGAIVSDPGERIAGFALHGSDVGAALMPLIVPHGVNLTEHQGALEGFEPASVRAVPQHALGCASDHKSAPTRERVLAADSDCPRSVTLTYHEASRDYQTGLARIAAEGGGQQDLRIELPAGVDAAEAKLLAERLLAARWREREQMTLHLPTAYSDVLPGTLVQIEGEQAVWRVVRSTLENFVVTIELVRAEQAPTRSTQAADGGRSLKQTDVPAEPTQILVLELPPSDHQVDDRPVLHVAVGGGSKPWRPVPLEVDANNAIQVHESAASKSIMGVALEALDPGGSHLLDLRNDVLVQLDSSDWLTSCDDLVLAARHNRALIGEEVIQFGMATAVGNGRFRLSRLLRGRQGTEHASGRHVAGERFVLLEPQSLLHVSVAPFLIGSEVRIGARGVADAQDGWTIHPVSGLSLKPPSPVHLKVEHSLGETSIRWTRRSRRGWSWLDHVDVPLAESIERYRVEITGRTGNIAVHVERPQVTLAAAELQALGAGLLTCSVRQIGDYAISEALTATFSLTETI